MIHFLDARVKQQPPFRACHLIAKLIQFPLVVLPILQCFLAYRRKFVWVPVSNIESMIQVSLSPENLLCSGLYLRVQPVTKAL